MSENKENIAEVAVSTNPTDVKVTDIFDMLAQKVSGYNAKLLLTSACVSSGISSEFEGHLNESELKQICLELIKKGGPSFQVGKEMYAKIG